jgi:DNA polymerase-3 subunit epsilon
MSRVAARLAEAVGQGDPSRLPVAVVHFARFEEPYLRQLLSNDQRLPLEIVCTHALARRLLPTLPRRGLRAVAGYLGHPVPELRRAGHHVAATLLIWRGLVALLAERGVRDLETLREWMREATPRGATRAYPMEASVRLDLPHRPGVYRLLRTDGSVLYVGKATSLRQRVNTYFQTSRGHRDRTLEMLAQARAVDVTTTESALEAALLEPDEIKRLRPPYNVALQERDRRLGYWSWTLRGTGLAPDDRHPHGPFPLASPRPPLSALLQLLDGGAGGRLVERLLPGILGVPRRYAPPLEGSRAGLDLFVTRHGRWWTQGSPVCSVRALAWRLRCGATHEPRKQPSRPEASSPRDRWSPEDVAEALEQVVARGAHALRRSRWLCALSECSLAWAPDDDEMPRRCLVLSRGAVVASQDLPADEALPVPPGHARHRRERQEALDLAAYDRLSALSRELRGVVAGGGPVHLRLGPGAVLDRRALAEALRCL